MPRAPGRARPAPATSSQRASGSEWVSGSASTSNARVCNASPARIAVASSNALWRTGLAAPQVVVVHRRQVVVHQRIGVQHLDRGGDPRGAGLRHREQGGGLHHQEGPQPLAAAQRGVAHGLGQARLGAVDRRQQSLPARFPRRLRRAPWPSAGLSPAASSARFRCHVSPVMMPDCLARKPDRRTVAVGDSRSGILWPQVRQCRMTFLPRPVAQTATDARLRIGQRHCSRRLRSRPDAIPRPSPVLLHLRRCRGGGRPVISDSADRSWRRAGTGRIGVPMHDARHPGPAARLLRRRGAGDRDRRAGA